MLEQVSHSTIIKTNSQLEMVSENFYSYNLLYQSASNLISIITQLKRSFIKGNISNIRETLINEILIFEKKSLDHSINKQKIDASRYILCASIDELILNQQLSQSEKWEATDDWSQRSLIHIFYRETWGGEKFFTILDEFLKVPDQNRDFLELALFCLCMGFEGKYGLMAQGQERLSLLREKLKIIIQQHKKTNQSIFLSFEQTPFIVLKKTFSWIFAILVAVVLTLIIANFWVLENRSLTNEAISLNTEVNSYV
jgi:type VI secretion system protein ImpK